MRYETLRSDQVRELLASRHAALSVNSIDEDARAWFRAIGVDKATLRKFWNKSGTMKRERAV